MRLKFAGCLRVIVYVVLFWWLFPNFTALRVSHWPWELTLRYGGGFLMVLAARFAGGGRMGLQKELLGVWADALSIVRTAGVVYDQPWRRSFEQIVIRIRLMRHYATYGPFGIVTFGMLYNPLVVGADLWSFFAGRRDDFQPPLTSAELLTVLVHEVVLCMLVFSIGLGQMAFTNSVVHRYFSHNCFRTSRLWNFVLGSFVCTSGMTPITWAAVHRRHHRFCDQEGDPHSPYQKGFLYAAMYWLADRENFEIRSAFVTDWLATAPELLFLELYGDRAGGLLNKGMLNVLLAGLSPIWLSASPVGSHPFALAYTLGRMVGVNLVYAFNGIGHGMQAPEPRSDIKDGSSPCRAIRLSWYWWIVGSEIYHDEHHDCPAYAVYGPWYQDCSYCIYAAMAKCGLVWAVKTPWSHHIA